MLRRLASLLVCAAVALSAAPTHAQEPAQEPEQMVWLPYWSMPEALGSVRSTGVFDVASPFWYDAAGCGRVVAHAGAGSPRVLAAMQDKGLRILPTVTASGLRPRDAIRCLGSADSRRQHVRRVVRVVESQTAYDGVDVDYEHLALTTRPRQAKRVSRAFSLFVEDLCAALGKWEKACHITVMPRTSDRLSVWRGKLIPGVFDYARIGAAADRVRVMAYDQHAHEHGPGPIAGLPWVRKVAAYSLSRVPAAKTVLGIPTYARDFTRHASRSLTTRHALALARSLHTKVRLHPTQREGVFTYRSGSVRHTVWVSTKEAVAERNRLARELGLAGVAYWAAGMEQPGTWGARTGERNRRSVVRRLPR